MKKYKLIKWYPSMYLNEVGFTVKQKVENGDYYSIKDCGRIIFKACEIENHPEFWEEVVEKDYEILSLIYKDNKKLCYLDKRDGFYKYKGHFNYLKEGESNLKACLENNWSIHSVKRLSDSEVFTVGDRIENTSYPHINDKIYEISLVDNKIRVYYQGYDYLENISHCKKVLLETEDGVDIFEGDEFWFLNKNLKFKPQKSDNYVKDSAVLYFSTEESAEEYILMNKPCLSYEEIMEVIPFTDKDREIQKNLKELVKSKLE